ncbi:MAG: EamA family transporter [Deltaproteobacteria bacterium]|nr:EamA family transporter [Deltaproteobacteria bacterium]
MTRAHLFMLATVLVWGTVPLLDRVILKAGVDPVLAVTVRSVAAVVAALGVLGVNSRFGLALTLTPLQVGVMCVAGVLASLVGNYFYFHALRELDSGLVVAATSTYPAVTLLLAWALLGEKLLARQWVAIVVILAGLVLLEWPAAGTTSGTPEA